MQLVLLERLCGGSSSAIISASDTSAVSAAAIHNRSGRIVVTRSIM